MAPWTITDHQPLQAASHQGPLTLDLPPHPETLNVGQLLSAVAENWDTSHFFNKIVEEHELFPDILPIRLAQISGPHRKEMTGRLMNFYSGIKYEK